MKLSAKHLLAACAVAALGIASQTQAATTTSTFAVNITLTSACQISTAPTPMSFTYTSLQATAASATSSFAVRCTNTLPITSITLDNNTVTDTATDLIYTLSLTGAPTVGTGAPQTVSIAGSMVSGQAGKCATATCSNTTATNKTRTVTVTY